MKALLRASVGITALVASSAIAWADCGIEKGSVRILSNDFEALHIVASGAEECASPTVTVTKNQTTEHKNIQVPALTTDPGDIHRRHGRQQLDRAAAQRRPRSARSTTRRQVRPGPPARASSIRIDGKVMAIAFMVNAQHLFYRKDILDKAGADAPTTYEDMLADAAKAMRDKGIMRVPARRQLQAGLGPRRGIRQHVLGLRRRVLRSRLRRARHRQREGRQGPRDHEGAARPT